MGRWCFNALLCELQQLWKFNEAVCYTASQRCEKSRPRLFCRHGRATYKHHPINTFLSTVGIQRLLSHSLYLVESSCLFNLIHFPGWRMMEGLHIFLLTKPHRDYCCSQMGNPFFPKPQICWPTGLFVSIPHVFPSLVYHRAAIQSFLRTCIKNVCEGKLHVLLGPAVNGSVGAPVRLKAFHR